MPDRPSGDPQQPRLVSTELAENGISAKLVYKAPGAIPATFESGSYFEYDEAGRARYHHMCISTAGGCTRKCTFCAIPYAALGFERLLTAEEIVFQVNTMREKRSCGPDALDVIGLMGNGEPPDNRASEDAVDLLLSRAPLPYKVVISTIGENLVGLGRLLDRAADCSSRSGVPVIFQLSLHSAIDSSRRRYIPGRKGLEEILWHLDRYAELVFDPRNNPWPVRVNVVLMREPVSGENNATAAEAHAVARLVTSASRFSGRAAHRKLKVSSFNWFPGSPYLSATKNQIRSYLDVLDAESVPYYRWHGNATEISKDRVSGGFACGQLRATTQGGA